MKKFTISGDFVASLNATVIAETKEEAIQKLKESIRFDSYLDGSVGVESYDDDVDDIELSINECYDYGDYCVLDEEDAEDEDEEDED